MSILGVPIPQRLLVEGVAALCAAAAIGVLTWLLLGARTEVGRLEAEAGEARAAITAEQLTVSVQAQALADWTQKAEEAGRAAQAALVAAAKDKAALAAERATRTTEESADVQLPDCARLLAMDLSVCPAHARWLHADGVRR